MAWVTTTEREWDTRERSLMLALDFYEAGQCRRCGEHLSHAADPMTDPDRPEAPRMWVGNDPDECHSCKALHRKEAEWAGADEDGPKSVDPWLIFTSSLVDKKPRIRSARKIKFK